MTTRIVTVGAVKIGGGERLVLIAGPCVIESERLLLETGRALKKICAAARVSFILKTSYDKANRTSADAFRGPGLAKGLAILKRVKRALRVPLCVDVHAVEQVAAAAGVADMLQIPAFLCRQTDLLKAVCESGRAVNVKKGQFLAPWDVKNIIGKFRAFGGRGLTLTERGASFGYNNLINDMRALPIMRRYGYPVIFDATHSVQLPGGLGGATGGQREFVRPLARAAVATGCDGLFLEVHPRPGRALCDGPNQISFDDARDLLRECAAIHRLLARSTGRKKG
ncbi:MAG: 3-deoxy-8-phosphooctulonate synthase [Candidatus Aureabacteria bacterium]|nr:3-deoxy-8-phosphooctulonate synthase [Candidatus Auribacterota bacterium]